jgi:hypothetical protein
MFRAALAAGERAFQARTDKTGTTQGRPCGGARDRL